MNRCPTLCIVDEFASLRRFDLMLDAISRLRGYGFQAWLFLQSLSQARIYRESYGMVSGLPAVMQYFGGSADEDTCKKMAELSGKKTIPLPTSGVTFGSNNQGSSSGISLGARDCYMPDEVARLREPKQLIHYSGKGMIEGILFHPSLEDFPEYLRFMDAIEAGEDPEFAASEIAWETPDEYRPATPPVMPTPIPRSRTNQETGLGGFLDRFTAFLMGHDGK